MSRRVVIGLIEAGPQQGFKLRGFNQMSARTLVTYYPIGAQYDESGNDAHLCGVTRTLSM